MARELTEKEKKRTEEFIMTSDQLKSLGYSEKQLTVSVTKANVMALVIMLPPILVVLGLFYLTGGRFYFPDFVEYLILFLLMVVSMPVHEWIHGITWGIFSKNHMKDIEYGFIWQLLTPYCTCKGPLKKHQYIIGSMMPAVVLGVVTSVVGICLNSFFIVLLGCYNIFGGGGDFNIIIRLLRYKTESNDVVFIDHPTELGLAVFEK